MAEAGAGITDWIDTSAPASGFQEQYSPSLAAFRHRAWTVEDLRDLYAPADTKTDWIEGPAPAEPGTHPEH